MLAGNLVLGDLGQVVVNKAFKGSLGDRLHFGVGPKDYNHPRQLAFVLVEILLVFDDDAHALALNHAVRARRPGFRVNQQRHDVG